MLIVSQALVPHQDGVTLHPDLFLWDKQLADRKQSWFHAADRTPAEWYASLQGSDVTALLARQIEVMPAATSQCWSVTPYHGQLMRDSIRVYPEGLFPWCSEDAAWLCSTLNPLLAEEGMTLLHSGAALLLSCRDALDAKPLSFAAISGKMLPNRHHEGADGGRLNRLMAEIQMMLHQQQPESRRQRGEVDVSGIWLSNPVAWPQVIIEKKIAVATRNPQLGSLVDGRDAKLVISEAERLDQLVKGDVELPKKILLTGEGYALLLVKSLLPTFGRSSWIPKRLKTETELIAMLSGWIA